MNKFESFFEIRNTTSSAITFILEPWANEIELHPGSVIRAGFMCRNFRDIPIVHENGRIIVEAWEDAESTGIWLDGDLVA